MSTDRELDDLMQAHIIAQTYERMAGDMAEQADAAILLSVELRNAAGFFYDLAADTISAAVAKVPDTVPKEWAESKGNDHG